MATIYSPRSRAIFHTFLHLAQPLIHYPLFEHDESTSMHLAVCTLALSLVTSIQQSPQSLFTSFQQSPQSLFTSIHLLPTTISPSSIKQCFHRFRMRRLFRNDGQLRVGGSRLCSELDNTLPRACAWAQRMYGGVLFNVAPPHKQTQHFLSELAIHTRRR